MKVCRSAGRFLELHHRRSNVDTVFAMVKAKFGDTLYGRTEGAQTTEVLAKLVAHNLCALIQSFYELGVEPSFDSLSAALRSSSPVVRFISADEPFVTQTRLR